MSTVKRTRVGLLAAGLTAIVLGALASCGAVAHATDSPYTTVVWLIPNDDLDPNAQDQPFVGALPGSDIAGASALMTCGHRYQVDVYRPLADGTPALTLWAGGALSPNQDGAFLAYDLPFTPYAVVSTPACTEEPNPSPSTPAETPPPTAPSPTDSPTTSPTSSPASPPTGSPAVTPPPTAPSPSSSTTSSPSSSAAPSTSPTSTPTGTAASSTSPTAPSPSSGTIASRSLGTSEAELAMTGSEHVWRFAIVGLVLLAVGALAVYFATRRTKEL